MTSLPDIHVATDLPGALRRDTHDSTATVKPLIHPQQQGHKLQFADGDNSNHDPDVHRLLPTSHQYNHEDDDGHGLRPEHASRSLSRLRIQPNTPAARTGPPRSLSFAYALPGSPSASLHVGNLYERALADTKVERSMEDDEFHFSENSTDFRGALEYASLKKLQQDRKGKSRDSNWNLIDDSWNPIKWFQESPKEEKPGMNFSAPASPGPESHHKLNSTDEEHPDGQKPREYHSDSEGNKSKRPSSKRNSTQGPESPSTRHKASLMRRAFSLPHPDEEKEKEKEEKKEGGKSPIGSAKWARLRALLPQIIQPDETILPGPSAVTSQAVNITDELITGGLSTLMLRLWFEHDEKHHRRIPILLHRLRIRVSDSLHPMQGHRSVFRIECEYANGAARWVVYRELRDFLSLHAHYTVSNVYNRNVDKLPEFPKTSLPYFKFLKKEGKEKGDKLGRADFARLQREALENYLIDLIRTVMFHPSSNRLAGFLEISALSIALAQSGGAQYKAGFLKIESSGGGSGGFGRKSAGWREKKEARWCAVRESYLVAMEEPGELSVHDVFLLDSDFRIERPKRYYRQGLGNLLSHEKEVSEQPQKMHQEKNQQPNGEAHPGDSDQHEEHPDDSNQHEEPLQPPPHIQLSAPEHDRKSIISSVRSRVSKLFHIEPSHRHNHSKVTADGHAQGEGGTVSSEAETRSRSSSSASSSSSSMPSRAPTPMLDPSTNTNPLQQDEEDGRNDPRGHGELDLDKKEKHLRDKRKSVVAGAKKKVGGDVSKHTFYIVNSQMRLKLFARNERQMLQFITALEKTAATSHYTGKNRFDSFAPIRLNVAAQWLVDGRDYFWNLSRAILLAKETIYIHDWWLSPELLMRRPNKDRYRLDRLLERKAKEGVKIYVILYQEVSNKTTPTDSNYAKQRLINLHPNVMVQRSPSHFQTGTFYWAHHEKMCVIDQTIAFMGGVDLCFGRWDTAQHVLADDAADTERSEIWPGKDYSNPRMSDFHTLNKPEEDMYDRTKVPRMPWHDVGMQVVGQPARDLARHFVQRWNYLLRIKNHSRVMPFLLPPPEFRPGELTQLGLTGTCELQICRSAGPWSLGTPAAIEHSIQNAYLKAIQMSEHFVYIENQFFITSTVVNDVKVENNIGDAIVHRIIRAHRDGAPWKCCIMIPVLPGFTFPVDHSDASAIRIILECQNRTIARGPNSIFSRLRKEGIDPDEYISVFSLRNWAKLRGDVLTTEQVYIHAKVCIVDDRLAIIGSANINERSQRGDRDSELAAVIRDTDLIDSTMAGKPFKVGRFAHTLRVRLMREHLGIDVDALDEEDLMSNDPAKAEHEQETWDPDQEQEHGKESGVTHVKKSKQRTPVGNVIGDGMDSLNQAIHVGGEALSGRAAGALHSIGLSHNAVRQNAGDESLTEERKDYARDGQKETGFASSVVPTLEEKMVAEQRPPNKQVDDGNGHSKVPDETIDERPELEGEASTGGGSTPSTESAAPRTGDNVLFGAPANASRPDVDNAPPARSSKNDADEEEQAAPEARSKIRDTLKSGKRHQWTVPTKRPKVAADDFEDPISEEFWKNIWVASAVHNTEIYRKVFHAIPDDLVTTWKQYKEFTAYHERLNKPARESGSREPVARLPSEAGDENALQGSQPSDVASELSSQGGEDGPSSPQHSASYSTHTQNEEKARRPAKGTEPFEKWEREEMEKLLGELNGHLVVYSNRFLEGEDIANNFLFNADRLLPLPIYN